MQFPIQVAKFDVYMEASSFYQILGMLRGRIRKIILVLCIQQLNCPFTTRSWYKYNINIQVIFSCHIATEFPLLGLDKYAWVDSGSYNIAVRLDIPSIL